MCTRQECMYMSYFIIKLLAHRNNSAIIKQLSNLMHGVCGTLYKWTLQTSFLNHLFSPSSLTQLLHRQRCTFQFNSINNTSDFGVKLHPFVVCALERAVKFNSYYYEFEIIMKNEGRLTICKGTVSWNYI